jgi:uncharacterized protein YbjT (DUF2867 family)
MNILVTGATGFIASQVVTDLIVAGHTVTCCVRNVSLAENIFPQAKVIQCHFANDVTVDAWQDKLKDIDVVINCVGIFYHPDKNQIWNIHYHAPRALFDACVLMGVKKVIQISALGVDRVEIDYAKSKKAADDYLLSLPIQSTVLRPSLVYGCGSYGGTSLFRGLAGLPGIVPLPGKGEQLFQPIYLPDLSKAILNLIEKDQATSQIINAVSQEKISLKNILTQLRAWLGFNKAKWLFIPLGLIRFISKIGNWIPYSTVNTTAYHMLMQHSITTVEAANQFQQLIGFKPKNFTEGLYHEPSTEQDRWHARLFFLKPILRLSLAFVWLFTALSCFFFYPKSASYALLAQAGVKAFWQPILFYSASILDAVIGLAMLINYRIKLICLLQIVIIVFYTGVITIAMPQLWFEPFGPITKNIPFIVAVLILLAME